MLYRDGSQKSYQVLMREWTREDLHRDLRIVLIENAFKIIASSTSKPYAIESAWEILTSCTRVPHIMVQTEVQLALLAPDITDEAELEPIKRELKARGYNPGTCADLTVASVFAHLLSQALQQRET